jgi:cell division protein FtsB
MAQDFRASFGLGDNDRSFHSVDAHGVALAAIQALEGVVSQQNQRIEKLERENRALGQRLRALDTGERRAGPGR